MNEYDDMKAEIDRLTYALSDALMEIANLRATIADLVKALVEMVEAWEELPGGLQQPVRMVERWLIVDMKPAIDGARAALAKAKQP
jgi:hypothetical protein